MMLRGRTEAETVRMNGCQVGDILEAGGDQIRITAIGEEELLCVWLDRKTGEIARESRTTLSCREWRKVEDCHACLLNQDMVGTYMVCGNGGAETT